MSGYTRLNPETKSGSPGASMFSSLESGVTVSSAEYAQYGDVMQVEFVINHPNINAGARILLCTLATEYRPKRATPTANAVVFGFIGSDGRMIVNNPASSAVVGPTRFCATFIKS